MNQLQAVDVLRRWDKRGRYVFTRHELKKLFPDDNAKTFAAGLSRLLESGLLLRACRGVYVNPHAQSFDSRVVERIAKALRLGEYSYVSLQSMLSEYGEISQIPVDRLTVMTTGRKGVYKTPYGEIEFTHTRGPWPISSATSNGSMAARCASPVPTAIGLYTVPRSRPEKQLGHVDGKI